MQDLTGNIIFILFGVLLVAGYFIFGWYLRYHMVGTSLNKKVLKYEILYQEEVLKKGQIALAEGEIVRFGYSTEERHHNQVSIEKSLVSQEEVKEEDLERMRNTYGTWFKLRREDDHIFVSASYTARENMKGHKAIFYMRKQTDDTVRILRRDEIELQEGIIVLDKDSLPAGVEVIVYDENCDEESWGGEN